MSLTPHSIFSTEHLVASERYAAWKESISVIFECEYEAAQSGQPFEARLEALQFDQSLLVKVDSSESDYRRRPASIRMDGLDAILIQLFIKGGVQFCSGKKVTYGKAGDLVVFDLNQEIQNHNTCFQHLTIVIPREMISPLVPNIEHWHGRVLPRDLPTTILLRSHLLTLFKGGSEISASSGGAIQSATVELAAAAFIRDETFPSSPSSALAAAQLQQIKQFIKNHISNPRLSPEMLAYQFGLSRAQFYRVTKPLNGIKRYISNQRLKKALGEIQNPRFANKSLTEIAFSWGFNDYGTFNRSFKIAFGCPPSDVRYSAIPHQGKVQRESWDSGLSRDYEDWIRNL